jgi:hypothetical protein
MTSTERGGNLYQFAKYGWEERLEKLSRQVKAAKRLISLIGQRIRLHDVARY